MFIKCLKPTPLWNIPDFEEIYKRGGFFDERFLLRPLEMVLLKNSVLEVVKEINKNVLQVVTKEYFSKHPLYIDRRFVSKHLKKPIDREPVRRTREEVVVFLQNTPWRPYVWGGNLIHGIQGLFSLYQPEHPLSSFEERILSFWGVDCSGLLYEAVDGAIPRNTSQIFEIGEKVSHPNPLDLIIFKGHLLIVLPKNQVIESREFDGVVFSNLEKRLNELKGKDYSFLSLPSKIFKSRSN